MPTYSRSVIIDAPVDLVFEFHERPDALRLLSPPFPPLKVVRKTGGLEPGSQVELRVAFRVWIAEHTDFERNEFFVDRQIEGPFARWVHRHQFEDLGDTTRLTDRVEYLLPFAPFANWLLAWPVRLGLMLMFRHRHRVTKRLCEKAAVDA